MHSSKKEEQKDWDRGSSNRRLSASLGRRTHAPAAGAVHVARLTFYPWYSIFFHLLLVLSVSAVYSLLKAQFEASDNHISSGAGAHVVLTPHLFLSDAASRSEGKHWSTSNDTTLSMRFLHVPGYSHLIASPSDIRNALAERLQNMPGMARARLLGSTDQHETRQSGKMRTGSL